MLKIFFSSPYNIKHKDITEANALTMLKSDIRSKILGNVKDFVYASSGKVIKGNKNVMYLGGFYYEEDKYKGKYNPCEVVVRQELDQIDKSDLVLVSLLKYSAIASITELLYASFKNKKIVVFCDKNITQFETPYEYWFPLLTCMINNPHIKIIYVKNEDEIVSYINNLKEDAV